MLVLCLMSCCMSSNGQPYNQVIAPSEVSIGGTEVVRENREIKVSYQILLGDNIRSCNVELLLSTDGGITYSDMFTRNSVSGDVGYIKTSGFKQIVFDITDCRKELAGKELVFKVNVNAKTVDHEMCFLASAGISPRFTGGLMFGVVDRFGGYAKLKSNFRLGRYSDAGDETRYSKLVISGGFLCRATDFLYPYIGLGWGFSKYQYGEYYQFGMYSWENFPMESCNGVAADIGALLRFNKFAFSIGCSTINFKTVDFDLGIGIMF